MKFSFGHEGYCILITSYLTFSLSRNKFHDGRNLRDSHALEAQSQHQSGKRRWTDVMTRCRMTVKRITWPQNRNGLIDAECALEVEII